MPHIHTCARALLGFRWCHAYTPVPGRCWGSGGATHTHLCQGAARVQVVPRIHTCARALLGFGVPGAAGVLVRCDQVRCTVQCLLAKPRLNGHATMLFRVLVSRQVEETCLPSSAGVLTGFLAIWGLLGDCVHSRGRGESRISGLCPYVLNPHPADPGTQPPPFPTSLLPQPSQSAHHHISASSQ